MIVILAPVVESGILEAPLSNLVVTPASLVAIEERIEQLLHETSARYALLSDGSGQLICVCGETMGVDVLALAALVAANFAAARHIARLLNEPHFRSSFQQGEQFHLLTALVGNRCVLSVGFDTLSRLGLVKVLTAQATIDLANILQISGSPADEVIKTADFKAAAARSIETLFRDTDSARSG